MKQILRILIRNKVHTLISLLGLTLGFACSFAIVFMVHGIISIDKFHSKKNQLFKVVTFDDVNRPDGYDASSALLGSALKDEVPGIENYCRYFWANDLPIGFADNYFKESGLYADKSLFEMFDFPLTNGNVSNTAFEPNEILISEKMANKLFGRTNITGAQISLFENNAEKPQPLTIKGVFKDLPLNSTFRFNYVLPFSLFLNKYKASWGSIGARTYVQIPVNADLNRINEAITAVAKNRQTGFPENGRLKLVSILNTTNLYKFSGAPGPLFFMVIAFSLIGLSILIITIINFINISIAQSVSNAKEVAIRKVNGAGRFNISSQFFLKTSILIIASAFMGYFISPFILKSINQDLPLTFDFNLQVILILLFVIVFTIVAAALYPAIYLNRINPAAVFSRSISEKKSLLLSRKSLVIVQFVLAIVIITASSILWQQNRFIYNGTFGMDRLGVVCFNKTRLLNKSVDVFKEELTRNTGISSVTFANQLPIKIQNSAKNFRWEGKDPNVEDWYSFMYVGSEFLKTLNINLIDGRDFLPGKNDLGKLIINSKAASMMSIENLVGKQIEVFGKNVEIVGLVEDFNHQYVAAAVKPLFIVYQPDITEIGMVKLTKGKEKEGLAALEATFNSFSPGFPFDYYFLDDAFNEQHKSFRQVNAATNIFGIGAIIIACIGMLGLSVYINERRRKEIGIRKVNGATIANITATLYSPLLKWLLIALTVAFPAAYLIMDSVLVSFANRVSITIWPFLLSLVIVLFIVFISTGWYIIKVALQNPVEALRNE